MAQKVLRPPGANMANTESRRPSKGAPNSGPGNSAKDYVSTPITRVVDDPPETLSDGPFPLTYTCRETDPASAPGQGPESPDDSGPAR